ncbi:MAG: hypothetical protein CM15mV104_020 [Caudoviricetes sp.]|nr:MAG: hypothetical protein CM15mV104_020 [Caudoviricetes sp.]
MTIHIQYLITSKNYRANVRAKSNEMESQIDACNNVDRQKHYMNTQQMKMELKQDH